LLWTFVKTLYLSERNPAAADLLRLCAFLAPDTIGEDMLMQGADTLSSTLAVAVRDGYLLDRAIETLRAYSLIARDTQAKSLAVHRLVQTVLRDSLPSEAQKQRSRKPMDEQGHYPILLCQRRD
jgi:hypothetical protein